MKLQPISKNKRIESVDALRGFALLGVLIANIPIASEELISGTFDSVFQFFFDFLINKKFIAIFSMLFGFGFYIQLQRATEKNINFSNYFIVRMLLLFLIGIIHSYGIWNGDILMTYALGGFLLLLIRKFSLKRLIILAVLFSVVLTGVFFILSSTYVWDPATINFAKELPLTTSFSRYYYLNYFLNPWTNFVRDMPITLSYTFGNMLIGFLLGKIGFFSTISEAIKKLRSRFILLGSTLGIISSVLLHLILSGKLELNVYLIWLPFVVIIGLLLQSLLYLSLFTLLYKNNKVYKVLSVFVHTGRTALSVYVSQSLFYIFIIFHCSRTFQLFGKITIGQSYLFAFVLFMVQSLISYFWLKKYTQGPLEYLWKKISYGITKLKKTS